MSSRGVRAGVRTERRGALGRRLARLGVATSGLSLLIASAGFLAFEAVRAGDASVDRIGLLADVTAVNSAAALGFGDPTSAAEALAALSADSSLELACLYLEDGSVFARRDPEGGAASACPAPEGEHATLEGTQVEAMRRVLLDREPVGWLYLQARADSVGRRLAGYSAILGSVLGVSILVSLALFTPLARRMLEPLHGLIDSSAAIADGDLTRPPPAAADDEIGDLAASFSNMSQQLRALVARVKGGVGSVRELNDGLRVASRRMQGAAEREAAAIVQVQRSVERTASSISQLSGRAGSASEAGARAVAEIGEVQSSISDVASSMDELGATVDGTVSSIQELTSTIDAIAASVARLEQTTASTVDSLQAVDGAANESGRLAAETESLTRDVAEASRGGRASVEHTMEAMADIRDRFDRIQKIVGELSERSEAIERVVEVIRGFADGSALLALNARIIAAQAGEHGRAFGVVAQEIGRFAADAASSVSDIEGLVRQTQGSTELVVEAVEQGAARVESGVSLSKAASAALREIEERSGQSNDRVSAIVEATQAQATRLRAATTDLRVLTNVVEEITRATNEQHKSSRWLASSAEEVAALVERVRSTTRAQRDGSSRINAAVDEARGAIEQTLEATRAHAADAEQIRAALDVLRAKADESQEARSEIDRTVERLAESAEELEASAARFTL